MRVLTWRGWVVAITIGVVSALITVLALAQLRHWLTDEQQLHEIVQLIQAGRLHVDPPPQAAPPSKKE